jgi:hypothetical protein
MRNAEEYYVYICNALADLLSVDSPTGYSQAVCARLQEYLEELGYESSITNKRLVKVSVKGKSSEKRVALSAHVDTLGVGFLHHAVDCLGGKRRGTMRAVVGRICCGGYVRIHLRDKILLFDVLLQEQKVVGQICGDNSCMLTHLLQDKTERKGAAERVAVGVIMGEDVVVVMPAQKRGYRRKLFSHLLPPHPPLY